MNLYLGSKRRDIDEQGVYDNYAAMSTHLGVPSTFWTQLRNKSEDQYQYLKNGIHNTMDLLSMGFPREGLHTLRRHIPLSLYAGAYAAGVKPQELHSAEDDLGLQLNKYQDYKINGGLPQYVSARKLGASTKQVREALDILSNPKILTRPKDDNLHPLDYYVDLLSAPGSSHKELTGFYDRTRNTTFETGLNHYIMMRRGGANPQQALDAFSTFNPEVDDALYERHIQSGGTYHEFMDAKKQGVDMNQYHTLRTEQDLEHEQAMEQLKTGGSSRFSPSKSRNTVVRPVTGLSEDLLSQLGKL